MAKVNYEELAASIMGQIGGTENVKTVTHCVTRRVRQRTVSDYSGRASLYYI